MTKESDHSSEVSVSFYVNRQENLFFPYPNQFRDVWTCRYDFSRNTALVAFASACKIVVLRTSDNYWGLYHGVFNRKAEMRKYPGYTEEQIAETDALEDFLTAWKRTKIQPTQSAYIFGGGFTDDVSECAEERQEAIDLIKASTDLSGGRMVVKWNDYPEGETAVLVQPKLNSIKVNFDFWDD